MGITVQHSNLARRRVRMLFELVRLALHRGRYEAAACGTSAAKMIVYEVKLSTASTP